MARIRSVHPGMASDEAYMSMSIAAKAAWPLLWTECDDGGVFEWKPIVLKARIFPADNIDFDELLTEYQALGCVRQFEHDGKAYGAVRNFRRFQKPKHPSYRFELPEQLRKFVGLNEARSPEQGEGGVKPTEKSALMEGEKETDKKEGSEANASGASAPSDPAVAERELFQRGKELLGKSSGGQIAKLLKSKGGNVALARAAIEQASTKESPSEFIGRIVATSPPQRGQPQKSFARMALDGFDDEQRSDTEPEFTGPTIEGTRAS